MDYLAINPRPSKHYCSDNIINTQILPVIGDLPPKTVQIVHFKKIRSNLMSSYSDATCRDVMKFLYSVMEFAVDRSYIGINPIDKRLLSFSHDRQAIQKESIVLTNTQIDKLNILIRLSKYKTALLLAFTVGIPGVCLRALKWGDMDFISGKLCVCRTVSPDENGYKFRILSGDDIRTMKLPKYLIKALDDLYEKLVITRKLIPDYNPENLMFTSAQGTILAAESLRTEIKQIGMSLGIDDFRYDDLIFNSLNNAIKCGVDISNIFDYYNAFNKTEALEHIYRTKQVMVACNE